MRPIARLYDSYADAASVVTELEASGIDHSNISIVANQDAPGRHTTTTGTTTRSVTGGGTSSLDPAQPDHSDTGAGTRRGRWNVAGWRCGPACRPGSVGYSWYWADRGRWLACCDPDWGGCWGGRRWPDRCADGRGHQPRGSNCLQRRRAARRHFGDG